LRKGTKHKLETIEKIKKSNTGRKHSEETRKLISEGMKKRYREKKLINNIIN